MTITDLKDKAEILLKSEGLPDLGEKFFKQDSELLTNLKGSNVSELIEGITEHLTMEGRPGSAEYMQVFSKSTVLDKELSLLEAGKFDTEVLQENGLPIMVDASRTTKEMINAGNAFLIPEQQSELLGSVNTLRYKLDQHIGKTAQNASDYYAAELMRKKGIAERLFGVKPEPYEIPFTPSETEIAKLEELSGLKYATREEAQQTFRRELHHMMRQRPGVIGLTGTASFSIFVGKISQELGGDTTNPINIQRIRNAHNLMTGLGAMEELQIYPEFGNAIESVLNF